MKPVWKRQMVDHVRTGWRVSIRRACRALPVDRSTYHYAEYLLGSKLHWVMSSDARAGDHICYYTNMKRFRSDYPDWELTTDLEMILQEFAALSRKVMKVA